MRLILAKFFRFLFHFEFFRSKFFGIHQKIFDRFNLFRGQVSPIEYQDFKLEVKLDDWIQENLFFLGKYEEAELKVIQNILKEGDTFIDVGANIGLFSLVASRHVGITGKVISFEPFPENFNHLEKHLQLNQIKNVQAENKAVGDEIGQIHLYHNPDDKNLGMVSTTASENSQKIDVELITLDHYFQQNPNPSIQMIKIDIEGHEYPALRGMQATLEKYKPVLLVEIIEQEDQSNEQNILQFLSDLGYEKFFIDDEGELQSCPKNMLRRNYIFQIA
ncbi:MAG: FkbM family methyltransferase [Crocinitomicaceae bacterium]